MTEFDLESLDWTAIYKRLVFYAAQRLQRMGLCDSWGTAYKQPERWVNEAVSELLDPKYTECTADNEEEVVDYLRSRINGLINNYRNKAATKNERLYPPEKMPDSERFSCSPEVLLLQKEKQEVQKDALDRLDKRISQTGDELLENVLLLELDGIGKPKKQAEELGLPVKEIYETRRKLKKHCEAVGTVLKAEEG